MRSSPRKMRGEEVEGSIACAASAPPVDTVAQLARLGAVEVRRLANEHGLRNAAGMLSRQELVARLVKHCQASHGVLLEGGEPDHQVQQAIIGGTIDKLKTRVRGKKETKEEDIGKEMMVEDMVMEEEEQVVPLQQERVVEGEYIIEQQGEGESFTIHTQQFTGEEEDVQFEQRREEEEGDDGEDDEGPSLSNMRYKIGGGEAEGGQQMVVQVLPKADCHAYVIARTVKELRDLGRDMLRIHAENHGVEHAGKLRMSELVREMIQHYNGVHNAGMEVSKLDMLKLNMLQLKKIKVDIREKTPPPDTANMVPKNVVPIEEQVHHVYEKRPDICTVEIIVNNLKDMLALGTSILRPEASKHRVCNSSRKQKLQVVEELWEHYLKFHLKQTSEGTVEREQGDELDMEYWRSGEETEEQDYIVVHEEDIVAGEDIHTAAEEVTA